MARPPRTSASKSECVVPLLDVERRPVGGEAGGVDAPEVREGPLELAPVRVPDPGGHGGAAERFPHVTTQIDGMVSGTISAKVRRLSR